ncbi:MAG: hypothetical protein ACYSTJ_04100 [Planctomycetota bacterium]
MKLSCTKTVLVVSAVLLMPTSVVLAAHSDLGCGGCHTPHNADPGLAGVPLWSGNEGTAVFTEFYSSHTFDAAAGQPDGASKMCLSCHDGANPSYSWMDSERVLADLTITHPISFVYDSGLAIQDGALKDPGEASTLGGSIFEDLLDGESKVQCISCHDVHTTGIGENQLRGYEYANAPGGAELCRMCHIK